MPRSKVLLSFQKHWALTLSASLWASELAIAIVLLLALGSWCKIDISQLAIQLSLSNHRFAGILYRSVWSKSLHLSQIIK